MSELDEIRAKYEAGKLEPIRRDLERFLVSHRADIDGYRKEQEAKGLVLTDESAVKFFLLRHRTINAQADIREQLEEIKRETWIRGIQKGTAPDGDEVALEWARSFSAGWRAHRLTTVVYVFEREKERYLALLKG